MSRNISFQYIFLILFILLLPSLAQAQASPNIILGDMNHDGRINKDDVAILSNICDQRNNLQIGTINGDAITFSTSVSYTPSSTDKTFLNGDLNFDNKITISDITSLINLSKNPASILYVVVRNRKIVFVNRQGFIFNPEEGDFEDDGEEEL